MNTKYTQESTLFVSALGKRQSDPKEKKGRLSNLSRRVAPGNCQSDPKVKNGRLSNLSRQTALRNARAVEEGEKCNYSYLSY